MPLANVYDSLISNDKLKVETGDLVLFPGWLEHGVDANLLDEPRINVAFNFGIPELVHALK